jgi:hypothetical protein
LGPRAAVVMPPREPTVLALSCSLQKGR